jgi:squalene-hopene/tetraprenyl-beta-curcumene cyclase
MTLLDDPAQGGRSGGGTAAVTGAAGAPAAAVDPGRPDASAREALRRAVEHLLALQHPAGWWQGELETNVTMDAEDLLLREFLGVRTPELTAEAARWIRSKQRADGSWANFFEGPADLSTTVESYAALKLAGDDPAADHMRRAADHIRSVGGLEGTRVFTRIWLALFGLWSWDDLPVMPPELIFLPPWFPLNVADWACWARQTVVPLTVVCALRPCRPTSLTLDELRVGDRARPGTPLRSWAGFFERVDRGLHRYERLPVKPLRRLALRRCAEWIIARQEADGSWGGIQPPWVYSLIALNLLGYPVTHPVMAAGLRGLDRFTIREPGPEGTIRRLEACQSPVWDTALAATALADAGLPGDHPALRRAANWMLGEEITVRGDWAVRRPDLAPGGWAFEFDNDGYPDTDDTAEVVLALRRIRPGVDAVNGLAVDGPALDAACRRGVAWTVGMASGDGGWGAFDADNTRELIRKLPFCDFGAVIDPPSADVTAHVVEMLAVEGRAGEPAGQRGVAWLRRAQEADGSWFGRWGANHVYGTGAVLPAMVGAGVPADDPAIRRGVAWLQAHQNPDGGWGEDLRSYRDPGWIGRGHSTASQTAWALIGLLAAGERGEAVRRGVAFLASTQRADGTWDEPYYTGTGFPGDFYINYHLYRLVFPVSALGRYVSGLTPTPAVADARRAAGGAG